MTNDMALRSALQEQFGSPARVSATMELLAKVHADEFLSELLMEIATAFPAIELTLPQYSADRQIGGKNWNDVRRDIVRSMTAEFASYLMQMRDTSITVNNSRMVDELWRTVISSAKRSIWTTNVNAPGSLGRSEAKLNLQRDAVNRGVAITRVFVFDEKDTGMGTAQQIRAMKSVFSVQLNAKVNVLAISRREFDSAAQNTSALGDDFMIVDSRFVYVTKLAEDDEQKTEWITSKLIDHQEYLNWAEEIRKRIEAVATPVTLQSLPEWFG